MKRPVLPIVIAVVLAMAAGVAVFLFTRGADDRALDDQQPVPVLISSVIIPTGTTLGAARDQGLLREETVSAKLRPAGSIEAVDAMNESLVALADIPAGQVLLTSNFGVEVPTAMPLDVPEGKLAIAVLLEDPAKVGTFLRPGSHIAVFDTVTLPANDQNPVERRMTRPLLDDVTVLAIGKVAKEQAKAAVPADWEALLVTVAVNQSQAEKLVHGIHTGALYLGLLGDGTVLKPSVGVTDQDVFN